MIPGSLGNNKVTEGTGRVPISTFADKRELRPRKRMELNTNFARLPTSATLFFTDVKVTSNQDKGTKFARAARVPGRGVTDSAPPCSVILSELSQSPL